MIYQWVLGIFMGKFLCKHSAISQKVMAYMYKMKEKIVVLFSPMDISSSSIETLSDAGYSTDQVS